GPPGALCGPRLPPSALDAPAPRGSGPLVRPERRAPVLGDHAPPGHRRDREEPGAIRERPPADRRPPPGAPEQLPADLDPARSPQHWHLPEERKKAVDA